MFNKAKTTFVVERMSPSCFIFEIFFIFGLRADRILLAVVYQFERFNHLT